MADNGRFDIEDAELGTELAAPTEESALQSARRDTRRRILTGGLAGAPLILTLTSRPALATVCSASAMASGNVSLVNQVTCRGLTPGYWKTHEQKCTQYFAVGPCNPIYEDNGQCDDFSVPTKTELEEFRATLNPNNNQDRRKIRKVDRYLAMLADYPGLDSPPFGTAFSEIFAPGLTQNPETTMMQALWLDDSPPLPPVGSGGPSPVLAHCAAAYCNACEFGREVFGYSPQELVDMVVSRILVDPFGLKDDLEMLNQRG